MSKWPEDYNHLETTFGGLTRSQLMSRIRGSKNKTTELKLIQLLRNSKTTGWRRNYHLLGKPDFVFPNKNLIVFVDGCFWHGHNCKRNLTPKSNVDAWSEKIIKNKIRDKSVTQELRRQGWKVVRIWECRLKENPDAVIRRINKQLVD